MNINLWHAIVNQVLTWCGLAAALVFSTIWLYFRLTFSSSK